MTTHKRRRRGTRRQLGRVFRVRDSRPRGNAYVGKRMNRHFRAPVFLIDENLPIYLVFAARKEGYRAVHIRQLWVDENGKPLRKVPDEVISKFAQDKGWVVVTRDTVSFPEPRGKGDRIILRDAKGLDTREEFFTRVRELGW